MKKILIKLFVFIVLTIVTSCYTSSVVAQNIRIQKRKYSNGYYISFFKKNRLKQSQSIENKHLNECDDIVQVSLVQEKISLNEQDIKSETIEQQTSATEKVIEEKAVEAVIETVNPPVKTPFKRENNSKNRIENKSIKTIDNKRVRLSKKQIKQIVKSQKSGKIDEEKLLFILLLILAFLLPPLAVLLFTNIDWKKVLIALILTCLWWGPGVLYAILVLLEIL